jgi:hypothetical protein
MKSLAHIFRDLVHHHGHVENSHGTDDSEQVHYLPLSEQADNQQHKHKRRPPAARMFLTTWVI